MKQGALKTAPCLFYNRHRKGERNTPQTFKEMKLAALALVGLLATPAHANLQEAHQNQQTIQNERDARRAELCENHLRQAEFIQPQNKRLPLQSWTTYYRVSRGDLYRINWYGYENNGPLRPKPCAVTRIVMNQDIAPDTLPGYDFGGKERYVVEGNEVIRYSNVVGLSWNPQNPNPRVKREVLGVRR